MYYGLTSKYQALEIAKQVCNVLGHGSNKNAVSLLIETSQQETKLGSYRDSNPTGAGIGLTQFDWIAVKDIKQRTPKRIADKLYDAFGVRLMKVRHEDLAYSPLLALIFCRLFYRLIPEPIPKTIKQRAAYWKKYYNTVKGKGQDRKSVV